MSSARKNTSLALLRTLVLTRKKDICISSVSSRWRYLQTRKHDISISVLLLRRHHRQTRKNNICISVAHSPRQARKNDICISVVLSRWHPCQTREDEIYISVVLLRWHPCQTRKNGNTKHLETDKKAKQKQQESMSNFFVIPLCYFLNILHFLSFFRVVIFSLFRRYTIESP